MIVNDFGDSLRLSIVPVTPNTFTAIKSPMRYRLFAVWRGFLRIIEGFAVIADEFWGAGSRRRPKT